MFGVDTTPCLRPYSNTLADRSIVYSANHTPGNKPIGVGHSFSVLAQLPEKSSPSPWILPLDIRRVSTTEKGQEVGLIQMKQSLSQPDSPFYNQLSVLVADSLYDTLPNWQQSSQQENLIFISRMRNNRNTYSPPLANQTRKKYGDKMKLNQVTTHRLPDEIDSFYRVTSAEKKRLIKVSVWYHQLLRGNRQFKGHHHPITLMRFVVLDAETQEPLFKRPLWLSLRGKKRKEITSKAAYDSYAQRFDLEHFFRFGKQRLLIDKFQTPEIQHEIHWWKIVQIAYIQLFLSRRLAKNTPRPWERYLPVYNRIPFKEVNPSQAQRYFASILKQMGTPAKAVSFRPSGLGRFWGEEQPKRPVHDIIFKNKTQKNAQKKQVTKRGKNRKNRREILFSDFEQSLEHLKTSNLKIVLDQIRDRLQPLHVDELESTEQLADLIPT